MSRFDKLARLRLFLRQVLHLSAPYFGSEEKWRARGLLVAIVALNLAAVYMLVLLNEWNRTFYDALQNKNAAVFWTQLGRFTYLALIFIVIAVYRFYLTQLLQLRWRAWMTRDLMRRWLTDHAFYRMELGRYAVAAPSEPADATRLPEPGQRVPDNPDQRLQEDVNLFTAQTVGLSMGFLNAVVTLASFVGILWGLSGNFAFELGGHAFDIPGYMVWMAVAYCTVGSVLTHYIGRPLIGLNFEQQRREANYRHHLVRVREYSESIALDKGEGVERKQIDLRFGKVLANYLRLLAAQKRLTWFTTGFGQAAVVFPFIVAAPRFFSGAIQLGELMQIASAFGRVQDSLSWFVDNYDRLASWRATTDRLTSFEEAFSRNVDPKPSAKWSHDAMFSGSPETTDLCVRLPDGETLLAGQRLAVAPGDRILLQGPSGSGKSTLFRALAGIWPFAQGQVRLPAGSMFIPQRAYFPNGPLRDALAYPEPPERYTDEALRQALIEAELPALANRLDEVNAWSQKLSGGEQQRLAIARVLLKQPKWVFADEVTSALDPQAEQTLYQRLIALVKRTGGGLISIAHRPTVAGFHGQTWSLIPKPEGATSRYRVQVATTGDKRA